MRHTERELELANRVYLWYRDHIGVREDPLGTNRGRFVYECQRATWLAGTGWAWCAAMVCRGYEWAGHKLPDPSAGAYDLGNRALRRDWGERVLLAHAKPGFPVVFRIGSGHIGVFESYSSAHKTITTIDGNTMDMVARRTRPLSDVHLIFKVKVVAVKPARKPIFQVVTSESGSKKIVASAKTIQGLINKLQKLRGR